MSSTTPAGRPDSDDPTLDSDAAGGPTLEDLAGGDVLPEGAGTDAEGTAPESD